MTKKTHNDKEKTSLFQIFKNPLSKSKSQHENDKRSRTSSKSRADPLGSYNNNNNNNHKRKDDRIKHVRRVVHLNEKYLNLSNNSINGVINQINETKREKPHRKHSHFSNDENAKYKATKYHKKYQIVDTDDKIYQTPYTDSEHERAKRCRREKLQKRPNIIQNSDASVFSDPQMVTRRVDQRAQLLYKSRKPNYSDTPPYRSKSPRERRPGVDNLLIKCQRSSNNKMSESFQEDYKTIKPKGDIYGGKLKVRSKSKYDKSVPSKYDQTLLSKYDQTATSKKTIPNGFFNSSDECSEGSTRKYLNGSTSPLRTMSADSDTDHEIPHFRKHSHRPAAGKNKRVSKCKEICPEETIAASACYSNVVTVETDDSESFVIHNHKDSERYAHKKEYKKTMAGYVDELNSQRRKIDILQSEKETLQRELAKVKMDFESLLPKYKSLKKSSKDLIIIEMERKSLSYKNRQLQQQIDTLSRIIEERDQKQISLESKLMEAERESSKYSKEAEELRVELNHYRQQLQRQFNEKEKFSRMKQLEQEKDLKIRLMHNEIIELKGNVRVLARFKMESNNHIYHFVGNDSLTLKHKLIDMGHNYFSSQKPRRTYTFNRVFRPGTNQDDVFDEVSPYVTSCIDGYNVCVMTYGQTGSGKTFTMKGTDEAPGIIPRAVEQMFNECNDRTVWNYKLYISILQVYNENMTDLLTDAINRVYIQDDGSTVFVKGLQEFRVKSKDDIEHYIKLGKKRCSTAKTVLNVDSSRSHFVVMLRVFGCSTIKNHETQGILTLCDLAGFEKFTANDPYGKQATETKFISKSLTVLARVFDSLRSKQRSVPYRESKLTHLLKPSLSGDAKCVLILTLSAAVENVESTLRSLDFGIKAMRTSLGAPKKNLTELNIGKEYGKEKEESSISR